MFTLPRVGAFFVVATMIVVPLFLSANTSETSDDETEATSEVSVCPKLISTFSRGARDATTKGQVSELQRFIADYYELSPDTIITGNFGRLTHVIVIRLQKELGLPAFGVVGSLTRAAIAKVCRTNGQEDSGATATNATTTTSAATTPTATSVSASNDAVATANGAGTASVVDLKINGSDGPIALKDKEPITVTWTSPPGMTCIIHGARQTVTSDPLILNQPASGSRALFAYITVSGPYTALVRCRASTADPFQDDGVYIIPHNYVAPVVTAPLVTSFQVTPYAVPVRGSVTATWDSINAKSCTLYVTHFDLTNTRVLLAENLPTKGSRVIAQEEATKLGRNDSFMPIVTVLECIGSSGATHSKASYNPIQGTAGTIVGDTSTVPYSQSTYYTQSFYGSGTVGTSTKTTYAQSSYPIPTPTATTSKTATSTSGGTSTQSSIAPVVPVYSQASYGAGGGSVNVVHVDTLTTSPSPLVEGGTLTATWTTTNATACTLYAGSNTAGETSRVLLASNVAVNGSRALTHAEILAATHDTLGMPIILVLECTGPSNSIESKVVSTLTSPVPVVTPTFAIDLKINGSDGPLTLTNLEPITVSWTSSGMTSCLILGAYSSIRGSIGTPGLGTSGSRTMYAYVSGSQSTSVLLRCNKTTGPVMDDTVAVNQGASPPYSQASYGGGGGGDGGAMLPVSLSRNLANPSAAPGVLDQLSSLLTLLSSLLFK